MVNPVLLVIYQGNVLFSSLNYNGSCYVPVVSEKPKAEICSLSRHPLLPKESYLMLSATPVVLFFILERDMCLMCQIAQLPIVKAYLPGGYNSQFQHLEVTADVKVIG